MFVRERELLFNVGWTVRCSEDCSLAAVCKNIVLHALNGIRLFYYCGFYICLYVLSLRMT